MKIVWKSIIAVALLVMGCTVSLGATELEPSEHISEIVEADEDYAAWEDYTTQYMQELYGENDSATNVSGPTFGNIKTEIDGKHPCLLGFAKGSYSSTQGHMTMCIGYNTISGYDYVLVVDGHSANKVSKMWSSKYNDYICKVRVK